VYLSDRTGSGRAGKLTSESPCSTGSLCIHWRRGDVALKYPGAAERGERDLVSVLGKCTKSFATVLVATNEGDEETLDRVRSTGAILIGRGLLVHFSTQPEPFLSLGYIEIEITRRVPQKVFNSLQAEKWTSVSPWCPAMC